VQKYNVSTSLFPILEKVHKPLYVSFGILSIPREVNVVTGEQKQNVQQIASSPCISENTIKSYCQRNKLPACDASDDTGNKECDEGKPAKTKTMIIGNTKYTINTFYNGKETFADILKRLIIRDLERTKVQ